MATIIVFEFLTVIEKGIQFYIQTRTLSNYFEVICFSLNVKTCRELSHMNHSEFAKEMKLQVLFAVIRFKWKPIRGGVWLATYL